MLSFTDFMKVFSAYEQYVQSATPAPQPMPTAPTPAPQPMPTAPTPAPQPMPTAPTPAPQPMPTAPTPAPQPMPTAPTPAPQPISMSEYVQLLNAFDQRLTAQENRPPMPTIDTPKPVTVDDIIMGIVGNTRKENMDGKQ